MAKNLAEHAKNYFMEPFEVVAPDVGAEYLVKDLGGKTFKKCAKEYNGEKNRLPGCRKPYPRF